MLMLTVTEACLGFTPAVFLNLFQAASATWQLPVIFPDQQPQPPVKVFGAKPDSLELLS